MAKPSNSDVVVRKQDLPLADRCMELRSFTRREAGASSDAALATAEMVFTTGAAVRRYDWANGRYYMEELVVEPGSILLDRLQAGAPLLNTHDDWDLEAVLGVVDSPSVQGGQGLCNVTFSRRPSVAGYVQDVEDKIIRNVSVGYVRHRIEMIAPDNLDGVWRYRVTLWEPYEVSLVPIPADAGAQVRSEGQADEDGRRDRRAFPCELIEIRAAGATESAHGGRTAETLHHGERHMTEEEKAAAEQKRAAEEKAKREAEEKAKRDADTAAAAETKRSADITDLCARHNVAHLAAGLIRGNQTVEQAQSAVLEELARRDAAGGGHRNVTNVITIGDEHDTRMSGIGEALAHRVDSRAKLTDNGRQYRGLTLLEMGRELLEGRGVRTRGMDRMTLATAIMATRASGNGMLGTSDFANLLANLANKRLRNSYDENPGTYQMWARRAPNAPDFKTMTIVQLAGTPDLLQVNEHGEFKYASMSDGKEQYGLVTYGRIVSLSRQAMVNDDLRGFDRLVTGFGASARRLENRTVYSQLTANANMGDGVALFHANHANLASGAGSALQFSSLKTMRAAMRVQKGLQSEELNLAPAYLIVPSALEQDAYQLTSSQYVPAKQSDVNEFRQGGRTALEPVVEPVLDANSATAWYAAAANSQVDTVEYCYLDGADGPLIESEVGFEVDGMQLKCRHDFAAKAVDWRGLYKAVGA